jgi:diaminohydroxyphosphoribosylaminopyrimidine deaminase/5-amino-6-(5-phosphoribosylamino)uracil reductase
MASNSKTITILTSPSTTNKALPSFPGISPTTGRPVQYRIEERKRTVYVTSDVAPTEWDQGSLETIFTLAEGAQSEQHVGDNGEDRSRRTRSLVETQITITEDESIDTSYDARDTSLSPRLSPNRSRKSGHSSSGLQVTKSTSNIPDSPRRSPLQARPRILFYHRADPHYGFTNFSPHPVMYKGKRYPTSEHLFQSFKVGVPWRDCPAAPTLTLDAVSRTSTQPRGAHTNML